MAPVPEVDAPTAAAETAIFQKNGKIQGLQQLGVVGLLRKRTKQTLSSQEDGCAGGLVGWETRSQ